MTVKYPKNAPQLMAYVFTHPERVAFWLALSFGLLSAVLVPQMTVNDESAHFLKAFSLSTGKIAGQECTFPTDVLDKANSIDTSLYPDNLHQPVNYEDTDNTSCGSARNYSPIMHIPQAVGIGVARLTGGSADLLVLFGRIANVIFFAVALYLIIRRVTIGKWAFVVVGLFPLMIHTAGSLSADVMNNVIVMGFVALLLNLFTQKAPLSQFQLITLAGLTILLALTKTTNVILLLPLVALPSRLFGSSRLDRLSPSVRKWLVVGCYGLIALLTAYTAQKLLGSALFFRDPVENPLESDPLRFPFILYNTYINPALGYGDLLMRGVIGEFSSFKYHLPSFIVFTEYALLVFVVFAKEAKEAIIPSPELRRLAFACVVAFGIFAMVVTFALYSAWAIQPNRLGTGAIYADGLQGRYFTAALLILLPLGFWLRKFIAIRNASPVSTGVIVVATAIVCLSFYSLQTVLTFN